MADNKNTRRAGRKARYARYLNNDKRGQNRRLRARRYIKKMEAAIRHTASRLEREKITAEEAAAKIETYKTEIKTVSSRL